MRKVLEGGGGIESGLELVIVETELIDSGGC